MKLGKEVCAVTGGISYLSGEWGGHLPGAPDTLGDDHALLLDLWLDDVGVLPFRYLILAQREVPSSSTCHCPVLLKDILATSYFDLLSLG